VHLAGAARPGRVAIKTAIAALQGKVCRRRSRSAAPDGHDPDFKEGVNYFPKLTDNFFVGNSTSRPAA
jgi:ribose transport system substrate-binding protein